MKKIITISILTIALLLTACSDVTRGEDRVLNVSPIPSNTDDIAEVGIFHGNRMTYPTLQHLLERADWGANVKENFSADLVVIGEFIEETQAGFRYQYDDYFKKDVVFDAHAYNQLLVTEVLKGKVKVGDTITVMQRYAFDEERNMLLSFDEMTPMHKGDRWIYFLKYDNYADAYESAGLVDGRYPIPNKDIMRTMEEFPKEARELNENYSERNRKIWVESRDKAIEDIDIYSLGVFNKYDFNFVIYDQILEHFQIESQDWVNPGRAYDARLLELIEQQQN